MWGGGCWVSVNEYSCAHGAQINFGDLTPNLTNINSLTSWPYTSTRVTWEWNFLIFSLAVPNPRYMRSPKIQSSGTKAFCNLRFNDMNGRSQMQGGKNCILPEEINENQFSWDSHWLEIWKNHLCPSMGQNGGRVSKEMHQCNLKSVIYLVKILS